MRQPTLEQLRSLWRDAMTHGFDPRLHRPVRHECQHYEMIGSRLYAVVRITDLNSRVLLASLTILPRGRTKLHRLFVGQ